MFKKITQKKISDEIIDQFKNLLGRGELKPGDKLPSERELSELTGVSRPPLREALNALQAMGFIEIQPRTGIIVKSITEKPVETPLSRLIAEDIDKVFEALEVRRAMEGWSAYLAAKRANKKDIERIEEIIHKDQANLKKNRDDAKTDADLHVTISTATHNTILSHLMATWYSLLWDTQKLSRKKIFKKKGNLKMITDQHLRLFEAIKNKDPEAASREARMHIEFVENELKKIIGEESPLPQDIDSSWAEGFQRYAIKGLKS
ncbi:MAG: FadR/GntR family transcriptional regulator [Desulfobacterales bacterium]|nr:FadR/GntR family transcriptional regulator [Desulfobacterales bacterium]